MRGRAFVLLAGTMLTSPAFAAIDAADYGVSASNADNAAALERAFAAGRGQEVILPTGMIRYGREVKADSVRIRGGSGTIMAPSNPDNQRIYLTGNSPSISDVRFDFRHTQRSGKGVAKAGVWVQNAKGFTVENVTFNGHAYGVPTKHGNGGGNLFIKNSQGGQIRNNRLYGTLADAIHMTSGSRDIDVTGNRIENASDDGIAAVAYGRDGTGDIRISGNTVIGNRWGRNITAVGSDNVKITNNYIRGNGADGAGVYIASEPAYNTDAPKNILVADNSIQDTGGPGKGHGQIMLWSGKGPISGVTVKNNEVRDSKRDNLAVVLSGRMNDVTLEGNNVDGEISRRNGGGFDGSNTTNDGAMANAAPVPAGTPAPSGGGGIETPIERNLGTVVDNINNTDEQFWNAVERGEADAVRRFNDLVSGGVLVRQGNRIINRATGQVTGAVNRTIADAVDAVAAPIEETVSSLGDSILCSIGGGWAAVLVKINICASKQLKIQGRQLEAQQKMVAPIGANAASGIQGIEQRARSTLGSVDETLYGSGADGVFEERYQEGMPDTWTYENSADHMQAMRGQTDLATREAAAVHAAAKEDLEEALAVSDETLALSQGAGGQTQAIQAQTQMMRSLIGVQAVTQTAEAASQAAALRTAEEQRAQEIIAQQKIDRFYGPGSLEPRASTGRALFQ